MKNKANIMVTGGAGYVGSHAVFELIERGHKVYVIDDLSSGHKELLNSAAELIECDINDFDKLSSLTKSIEFDSVIHYASKSIVPESFTNPFLYLEGNVKSAINIIKLMISKNVNKIIFSSSASVYGKPLCKEIDETHVTDPINPYGTSKLMIEKMLDSISQVKKINSLSFRYFNAVGANYKKNIGELHEPETHLIPNILNSTLPNSDNISFNVYGNDYSTSDGSCIRDYINVSDLADAHIKGLSWLDDNKGSHKMNLGTGTGHSVFEIIKICKDITKDDIKFQVKPRRHGDPAILVANTNLAKNKLGWNPIKTIEESILEAYEWAMQRK